MHCVETITLFLIPGGVKHDDTAVMVSSGFANILMSPQVIQKSGISTHFKKIICFTRKHFTSPSLPRQAGSDTACLPKLTKNRRGLTWSRHNRFRTTRKLQKPYRWKTAVSTGRTKKEKVQQHVRTYNSVEYRAWEFLNVFSFTLT